MMVWRQPSIADVGWNRRSVGGLTHRHAMQEGSKVISHNWVNNLTCRFLQNIHGATNLIYAVINLFVTLFDFFPEKLVLPISLLNL